MRSVLSIDPDPSHPNAGQMAYNLTLSGGLILDFPFRRKASYLPPADGQPSAYVHPLVVTGE